ncbi:hypothetical protein K469DRAFT_671987 [Zopfia rhizophila CBS 207.26]|uniref:Uncharacterized protein n=1 Tax=Zopfia rhizophila CBS 207.26 TaxID=1314779 RepID=A0A6A6DN55_9PEZI|nr:hypothetical protein K469DRAFT_671987 [Zopfia rhizophila CBS 207.26]
MMHLPTASDPSKYERKLTLREKFSPFPWKPFLVISILPFALAPIIILATAAEEASVGYLSGRDCYPNGMWSQTPSATWRIMDRSYFFTPNLSFGSMSFTAVKVIDITWDLIVGRGGQLLLAWVNYRVFNEWLVYHMEMHLTSYKMYVAVAFETTSLSTLGVLGKEFLCFGERNWRRFFRWLAVLCMFLSTLYVLAFPTLMAAMTGYITTNEAYVEDYGEDLIELKKFQWVPYVIEDAHRIGFSKPLVAIHEDQSLRAAIMNYIETLVGTTDDHVISPGLTFQLDNKSSTWIFDSKTTNLGAPTLNITLAKKVYPNISPNFRQWLYSYEGRQGDLYTSRYILDHGSCKPSETYQWGFSYIFLFMVSIFNFIWSSIMVGMWLDTQRGSRMYKNGRRPGLLRSIMDVSGCIREELGSKVEDLEENELRESLRDSGGALVVPRQELKVKRTETGIGDEDVRRRGVFRRLTKGSTF